METLWHVKAVVSSALIIIQCAVCSSILFNFDLVCCRKTKHLPNDPMCAEGEAGGCCCWCAVVGGPGLGMDAMVVRWLYPLMALCVVHGPEPSPGLHVRHGMNIIWSSSFIRGLQKYWCTLEKCPSLFSILSLRKQIRGINIDVLHHSYMVSCRHTDVTD